MTAQSLGRNSAAAAALVVVLAGCYANLGGPSLDDAPAEVRERSALPACGRTVENYVGAASDADAWSCFRDADLAGRPAEYLYFFFSDAGEVRAIYRVEADGTRTVYSSGIGLGPEGDSSGWSKLVCENSFTYLEGPEYAGTRITWDTDTCVLTQLPR